jgi:hypothetical protein
MVNRQCLNAPKLKAVSRKWCHNSPMLTALLIAGVMAIKPETYDLMPSDDVWVYPHASDPMKDPFLRAWGAGGKSVASAPDEGGEFSYSYLKWDLSSVPKTVMVVEAKLILTLVADPGYTEELAKSNPLEVRPVGADFAEKTWTFEKSASIAPQSGDKGFFGSGFPVGWKKDGKDIRIEIDLLKGPKDFAAYLKESLAAGKAALAITSKMDPSEAGRTGVYKWYSKDAEKKEVRPVLHLVVDPA